MKGAKAMGKIEKYCERGEYYFILFPGWKDGKDDEEYERLMLVYKGSYCIVVLIKIHLTRQ